MHEPGDTRRSAASTGARGAYVALDYPDLAPPGPEPGAVGADGTEGGVPGRRGALYVSLRQQGEVWVADDWSRTRPDDGPYLACDDSSYGTGQFIHVNGGGCIG